MLNVIKQLAVDGTTMVVVTHEMAFARDIADTVCFMDGGAIGQEGTPEEMLVRPQPKRVVHPGAGTVDFDVTFTVPAGAKEVRVFLPLSANKGATNTVATARFSVKP